MPLFDAVVVFFAALGLGALAIFLTHAGAELDVSPWILCPLILAIVYASAFGIANLLV